MFLQIAKNSTATLMNDLQLLVSEKSWFVFREKSDHFQLLVLSVHIGSDAVIFSRNAVNERCSADRNLLIVTINAEILKVLLKRMEPVYQDDSSKYAFFDRFHMSNFRSDEPNTLFGSQVETFK